MEKVRLVSVLGKKTAPSGTRTDENYWRLIGETGEIVSREQSAAMAELPDSPRVLVRFDVSVNDMGLACHNKVPNSLWIPESDLLPIAG